MRLSAEGRAAQRARFKGHLCLSRWTTAVTPFWTIKPWALRASEVITLRVKRIESAQSINRVEQI